MFASSVVPVESGYAPVNGLQLYYERRGEGGATPLIVLHGGFGQTATLGDLPERLAVGRQVIAVDLQGHGRTGDIDRPLAFDLLGDDIAALISHLELDQVDLMGYSLGGGVALRTAIRHPDRIRRLVLVSTPYRRDGWYPEVLVGMSQFNRNAVDGMRQSPIYQSYVEVAPDPSGFPDLMDKMGVLLREPYDCTDGVSSLSMPVMLVFGDADSVPPSHAAEFFALLGGGQRDAGWDRSSMIESRLAILPGATHYDIFTLPMLADLVSPFLAHDV